LGFEVKCAVLFQENLPTANLTKQFVYVGDVLLCSTINKHN